MNVSFGKIKLYRQTNEITKEQKYYVRYGNVGINKKTEEELLTDK